MEAARDRKSEGKWLANTWIVRPSHGIKAFCLASDRKSSWYSDAGYGRSGSSRRYALRKNGYARNTVLEVGGAVLNADTKISGVRADGSNMYSQWSWKWYCGT